MPTSDPVISSIVADFRNALENVLTSRAREAVAAALKDADGQLGGAAIEEVEFEITIKRLVLRGPRPQAAAATAPPSAPPARKAKPAPRRRTRAATGGTRGVVRGKLLEAFTGPGTELNVESLQAFLEREGVQSTKDNMHQQLGRLVRSGELERAGRGVYRRSASADTAGEA